jgi:hypothetical protein
MYENENALRPSWVRRFLRVILAGLGVAAFVLACALYPVMCSSPTRARETLEKSGFTHIETHGYGWFRCAESDLFSTNFTAKNPAGAEVEGVVCCGIFKSCTVRF